MKSLKQRALFWLKTQELSLEEARDNKLLSELLADFEVKEGELSEEEFIWLTVEIATFVERNLNQ